MQATADSLAFAPPPEPAAVRGFVLAVIAHLLLLIALTWGINWQSSDRSVAVEAELWSSIPQEVAPPPAPPQPEVQPPPVVQPAPPPPVVKEPDIAIEREKKRKEEELAKRREEAEQRKIAEAQKRKLEEQKLAEDKKRKDEAAKEEKRKQQLAQKKLDEIRKQTLEKMLADAAKSSTGTGPKTATGTAARAAGPSGSWGAKIRARVRPNIQVPGDVTGNPRAEVEVRLAPDGTIIGTKLLKSSGDPAWDRAVLRALDITATFPRDIDGSVHSPVILEFSRFDQS